ncbi:MAG: PEP-CTERM sorting domain-containing protein [Kiritimatiellae bacterium]|nr:PEP-CTERM sorting domain-containing protein [Kiritimatiellia bacterium]
MKTNRSICFLLALATMTGVLSASAVIIASADGSGNTTASESNFDAWNNVGRITKTGVPSSVTYVSNNWFLTAWHVRTNDLPTSVTIAGVTHTIKESSWTPILNADDSQTDLVMFRVNGVVTNAPSKLIPQGTNPTSGSAVTMIGHGRNRATSLTYWDADWNVTNEENQVYSGYVWGSNTGTKRWGSNTIEGYNLISYAVKDRSLTTTVFRTEFTENAGADEAQGATYDSGGGVYWSSSGDWYLSGIMVTIGFVGRSSAASKAVFGDVTYSAHIGTYSNQISGIAAVPEPNAMLLIGAASAAAFWRRRRRFGRIVR